MIAEIPLLRTERLLLRAFREEDLDAYAVFCADPEVVPWVYGKPLTRAEAWRELASHLGHWSLYGYGLWALELRDAGTLAGRVGLHQPHELGELEVGWLLGRRFWGKGFADEAARCALDHAFGELARERVISVMRPQNERSIRVAERLGMQREAEIEVEGLPALKYALAREAFLRGS